MFFRKREPQPPPSLPSSPQVDTDLTQAAFTEPITDQTLSTTNEIRNKANIDPTLFVNQRRFQIKVSLAILQSLKKLEDSGCDADLIEEAKTRYTNLIKEGLGLLALALPGRNEYTANSYSPTTLVTAKAITNDPKATLDVIKEHENYRILIAPTRTDINSSAINAHFVSGVDKIMGHFEKALAQIGLFSVRIYPKGTSVDTREVGNVERNYAHDGTGLLFISSGEIIRINVGSKSGVYSTAIRDINGRMFTFGKTDDDRAVFQQSAMRGCSAAVTTMILIDFGFQPNIKKEENCNIGDVHHITYDLNEFNIRTTVESTRYIKVLKKEHDGELFEDEVYTTEYIPRDLDKKEFLTERIKNAHCLVLSVGGEIGGHFIILDSIDFEKNRANIRDPYHGWSICTTADAILKRFDGEIIWIEKRAE